jgi:hypothetical protein
VISNEAAFRPIFRPEALVEMYMQCGTELNKAPGSAATHRLSADKQKCQVAECLASSALGDKYEFVKVEIYSNIQWRGFYF